MVMVSETNTARAPRPKGSKGRKSAAPRIRPWTRADLARLPDDGNRYEVLDGQLLVTPQASFGHQSVALHLAIALQAYVGEFGTAHVVGPGAIPFKKNELQPDVQVIPGPPRRGSTWANLPTPILVAEVLSTSTRHRDFGIKLDAYLGRVRVPVVWIVDREKREVHVCERGATPRIEREILEWQPAGAPNTLRIDWPALFREALGE